MFICHSKHLFSHGLCGALLSSDLAWAAGTPPWNIHDKCGKVNSWVSSWWWVIDDPPSCLLSWHLSITSPFYMIIPGPVGFLCRLHVEQLHAMSPIYGNLSIKWQLVVVDRRKCHWKLLNTVFSWYNCCQTDQKQSPHSFRDRWRLLCWDKTGAKELDEIRDMAAVLLAQSAAFIYLH